MSIIKSILHQIGLSADPAKNFTLNVPAAPDGTMKLSRGNAGAPTQDIISVDAAGRVGFPQNVRVWQNVGASRNPGTVYTNDTGQDIELAIQITNPANENSAMTIFVGATAPFYAFVPAAVNASGMTGYATVPAGATYKVELVGPAVGQWLELR